jgi:predicted CopG family antitoxin
MKVVKIDDNAYNILLEKKKELKKKGIENPTFSEAIRWLIK